ncbi:MAG: hypothetical protein JNL83_09835, partial [Myxococcales bacterium]|nr:hypothetical protein [Myxococcales bacterium]
KFRAKVDQWLSGASIWGFQAWNGALLGTLTGNQAYCTKAIAQVEAQVVAAEAKIAAGQAPEVAADSYLHTGELIGDLALTYDWCFDQVSPAQRDRWIAYANNAIANVWNHNGAKWGNATIPWSGWSVSDPSDNYYYSFLRGTMLLGLATKGENPRADEWIAQFRDTKVMGELIPTFNDDLQGGGSREGTGYGVAMRNLFELYDFWYATTGEKLHTKTKHTRASMWSFMHQTLPTLDRVAPTGDQSRDSTAKFFDYHRAYLQELVALFPNDPMAQMAKQLLASSTVPAMTQSFMVAYDFLYDMDDVTAAPIGGSTVYHAKGIGQLYARSGWDANATWVNFTVGPYTQSHAHQDQGSIMIYKNGWLAYDPVVDSRSGIDQAVTTHGLVRVDNGGSPVRQVASTTSTMQALHKGPGWVYASGDLTPAYDGNSAVQKVQRDVLYLEPDVVVVYDRVEGGSSQTWQLAVPNQPTISGNTATMTASGHTLEVTKLGAGTFGQYSYRSNADFTNGFRIDQTASGGAQRFLNVISIDGAATSITGAGDTAQVRLASGKTVEVTFGHDAAGATLTIDGQTTTLAAGVDDVNDQQ